MGISTRLWKDFFVGAEVNPSNGHKAFGAAPRDCLIVARL